MIKKSEATINVQFEDGFETNKLFARNTELIGNCLEFSYLHYSKRKRKNLEDRDYDLVAKKYSKINKIILFDTTIQNALKGKFISEVKIEISATNSLHKKVKDFDDKNGSINLL